MASRSFRELSGLMDLLDATMRVDMPADLLEGLDGKVNELAVRLGEDPSRWDAALCITRDIVACFMVAVEAEAPDSPVGLLLGIFIGRFLSHPMTRQAIKVWDEKGEDF